MCWACSYIFMRASNCSKSEIYFSIPCLIGWMMLVLRVGLLFWVSSREDFGCTISISSLQWNSFGEGSFSFVFLSLWGSLFLFSEFFLVSSCFNWIFGWVAFVSWTYFLALILTVELTLAISFTSTLDYFLSFGLLSSVGCVLCTVDVICACEGIPAMVLKVR